MNTPKQREEEEQTGRTQGSLNVVFGFCDINGGDMCKSKLGEREIISSYMHERTRRHLGRRRGGWERQLANRRRRNGEEEQAGWEFEAG